MFHKVSKALLASVLLGAAQLLGCPQPPVPTPPEQPDAAPRAALRAFLDAQKAGDFAKAYGLLDAPTRARYTPERLQSDYQRDRDLADDKLARARAALEANAPLKLDHDRAELPVGPDRAVHLVREDGQWHVASLE